MGLSAQGKPCSGGFWTFLQGLSAQVAAFEADSEHSYRDLSAQVAAFWGRFQILKGEQETAH